MREKPVAEQDAERISPARVKGRLRPAPFRFVDNIVVHQRRDVNQFHDHGKIDMFRFDRANCSAGQQRDQWAQSFSAATDCVTDITLDRRIETRGLADDL